MLWMTVCGGCGAEGQGRLCHACRRAEVCRLPVDIELVHGGWAIADYRSGLGSAVQRCKGTGDRQLAQHLARHLAAQALQVAHHLGPVHCVTWAPSPWTRRIRRGFHLAALLAHHVGGVLRVPSRRTLRIRPGARQAGSSAAQRAANLTGRVRSRGVVSGTVLLIDDVVTTGATARACARELLGAGADRVLLMACCYVVDEQMGSAAQIDPIVRRVPGS